MSNFKWQREAISKQRVLFRGARCSGKTKSAIEWARKQTGKNVLFGVPYQSMIQPIMDRMTAMYRTELMMAQSGATGNKIVFRDGTRIDFVAIRSELDLQMRGRRVDAVVLDEVGEMNDNAVISIMACAAHVADFSFFATYSVERKNGVKRIQKLEDVNYVTADYLDLLEHGILNAAFVRDMQNDMSSKAFEQEFGPYYERRKPTNKMFKHLLKAGL